MKLQDKETLSIATAVKDVLERKEVKEINYPHKMYSPEGEEVTANDKQEHEAYSAKGYTHDKPVEESPDEELTAGQKKLPPALQKAILKKQGKKEEVKETVVKEGPVIWLDEPDEIQTAVKEEPKEEEPKEEETEKQKKYQAFFQKALKKFGVKSPAELEGEKKKEFFDYIDKNYKSDSE
jgi:hypothetical protein